MVSGYILQAVGIYQSNTGDDRYCKPGSMTFEVSPKHQYAYVCAISIILLWDIMRQHDVCLRQ